MYILFTFCFKSIFGVHCCIQMLLSLWFCADNQHLADKFDLNILFEAVQLSSIQVSFYHNDISCLSLATTCRQLSCQGYY